MCHLQTRNYFGAKSRDQSDDVTNQLRLSRVSPSVSFSFIPCQKAEKWKYLLFSMKMLVSKLQVAFLHAQMI